MKEIRSIVQAYQGIDFSANRAALATVARVEGSAYRRMGARMLVLDNGVFLGGISGGCLEGDALRRAQKAIAQNEASVITYDTTRDDHHQIGVGLGCNGVIDVLFTPIRPEDARNPVRLLFDLTDTRVPRAVVSVTGCDAQPELLGFTLKLESEEQFRREFPFTDLHSTILADVAECLRLGGSKTVNYTTAAGESIRIFLEVIMPTTHLVIYGGNNDIYPMARIAKELGWDVSVVTNIHKAAKNLFSLADYVIHNKGDEQPRIDPYTALIFMTHDYKADFNNLQALLPSQARYIGMLGPRKRFQKMIDGLAEDNITLSEADLERIYAPAGLDIGALTPEEIALSIAAEIRACFADRPGVSLRLRQGTIH